VPDLGTLDQAISRYRSADAALAKAATATQHQNARRNSLLATALQHHADHGPGACPLCGIGTLDDAWAQAAQVELAEDGAATRALATAQQEHSAASQALARLACAIPGDLEAEAACTTPLPSAAAALAAWQSWADLTSAQALADAGEAALLNLADTMPPLKAEALTETERLRDSWQPIALQLAEWVPLARAARANKDQLKAAKAAHTWLRANADSVRNDRLRPLSERAQEIWGALRQQSNIDLGAITLSGSKSSRRVELQALVDGEQAGALEVMSQGERNALALTLFLPRAEMPDSPFGFIQIDDPVQAMDPAKVDGLAQVLHQLAQNRQVIVYTHDDRLPEAIRRLDLPATILGVTRSLDSTVSIREQSDPVSSYLSDARVIAGDTDLPMEVRQRVVPGLCRAALERRCQEIFYRRRLSAGASRTEIEQEWTGTKRTNQRLMLIVNRPNENNLDRWLANRPHRKVALGVCTSAAHNGYNGNPLDAVADVTRVVDELGAAHD
jgi:hypothetical protein